MICCKSTLFSDVVSMRHWRLRWLETSFSAITIVTNSSRVWTTSLISIFHWRASMLLWCSFTLTTHFLQKWWLQTGSKQLNLQLMQSNSVNTTSRKWWCHTWQVCEFTELFSKSAYQTQLLFTGEAAHCLQISKQTLKGIMKAYQALVASREVFMLPLSLLDSLPSE